MKNKRVKKTGVPLSLSFIRFIYNTLGPVFPDYFGKRAYQQWFTTFRFKTPAYELTALHSAVEEDIEVNGLKVRVYIWQNETVDHKPEDDEPVASRKITTTLFIHGWTGRGTQIAKYIRPLNAMGYRVLSFDGPAHGKTPGKQTSLLEFTDVVLALNKHYGPFDAAITHSFGGMVLAYAMAKGLVLKSAACICPPKNFKVLTDNFQRILALPDKVMNVLVRKTYESHGQITRDAVDMLNNVKNLDCKGLLIHDEDDDEISWHSSEEIARAWPGATFIKTSGLGHRRIIRDEQVVQHIVDFLGKP